MKTYWLGCLDSVDSIRANFTRYDWSNDRQEVDEKMESDLFGAEILLAYYDVHGYEGYAFILYRKFGQLYEVHGSHCSCYGLEGQWDPEETTIASLRHRLKEGHFGRGYSYGSEDGKGENYYADELEKLLNELEMEGYQ